MSSTTDLTLFLLTLIALDFTSKRNKHTSIILQAYILILSIESQIWDDLVQWMMDFKSQIPNWLYVQLYMSDPAVWLSTSTFLKYLQIHADKYVSNLRLYQRFKPSTYRKHSKRNVSFKTNQLCKGMLLLRANLSCFMGKKWFNI